VLVYALGKNLGKIIGRIFTKSLYIYFKYNFKGLSEENWNAKEPIK
jgi:nitrogen regulatory protein PII-like uncharacterized protein